MSHSFNVNEYWLNRGQTYYQEARLNSPYHRLQEAFLLQAVQTISPSPSALTELGCGFGRVTRLMAAAFPRAKILGLDLSRAQLDHARENCQGLGQVGFQPYDFYSDQPLPSPPCDLVLAIEVFLHHPPDLIRRLLRRIQAASPVLLHLDWFEPWTGALPEHVWIHDYPALHRELGWNSLSFPLPEKVDGKQQVLFAAGPSLSTDLGEKIQRACASIPPTPRESGFDTDDWESAVAQVVGQLSQIIPPGQSFILIDGAEWGVSRLSGDRPARPFPEKDGQFWGPPESDAAACRELDRVRELGVEWLAVGWNMSWWFEHYPEWNRRLREGSQRVLAHKLVTVFKLNP